MPRLPSDVLRLRSQGFNDREVFSFDRGMLAFERWIEAKKAEVVYVTPEDRGGKVPSPRYETLGQIFAQYDVTPEGLGYQPTVAPQVDIEAVLEAAYGNDVMF